ASKVHLVKLQHKKDLVVESHKPISEKWTLKKKNNMKEMNNATNTIHSLSYCYQHGITIKKNTHQASIKITNDVEGTFQVHHCYELEKVNDYDSFSYSNLGAREEVPEKNFLSNKKDENSGKTDNVDKTNERNKIIDNIKNPISGKKLPNRYNEDKAPTRVRSESSELDKSHNRILSRWLKIIFIISMLVIICAIRPLGIYVGELDTRNSYYQKTTKYKEPIDISRPFRIFFLQAAPKEYTKISGKPEPTTVHSLKSI
ncbi:3233_t:CDS:2, partial [Gigaspora rosea]